MKKLVVLGVIAFVQLPLFAGQDRPSGPGDTNLLFSITVAEEAPGGESSRRSAKMLALDGRRSEPWSDLR